MMMIAFITVYEYTERKFASNLPYGDRKPKYMMMIAFITINSGLVPLIEGLCAQILYFRCEIIGGLRPHLLRFFFGIKNMLKKKAVSSRSHPAFYHIHTRVRFVHIYEHMYAEI